MTKKRKTMLALILSAVAIYIGLVLSFNILMDNYIKKEASNALIYDSIPTNELKDQEEPLFGTNYIFYSDLEQYKEEYPYNYIYEAIKDASFDDIFEIDLYAEKYFCKKTTDPNNKTLVLFVNAAPIQRFITSVNFIFALISTILVIIIAIQGLKIGKNIEENEENLKKFFQNVSHELKTPIMNIQGYAEGIEKGILKDSEKAATTILKESDKMTEMVNEILELSKMETHSIKPTLTRCDIKEIVLDCFERIELKAKERNLNLQFESCKNTLISCDYKMMETAIINLLNNALRYANTFIKVSIESEKNKLIIKVIDDGKELKKSDMNQIFKRYYKGEKGLSGIGLALVKEIIELHKGTITVNKNQYTEFIITLKNNSKVS